MINIKKKIRKQITSNKTFIPYLFNKFLFFPICCLFIFEKINDTRAFKLLLRGELAFINHLKIAIARFASWSNNNNKIYVEKY
jgi:hypothetical protein